MAVIDAAREALDLSKLQLPPSPPVTQLECEDYTDAEGESALRILAVIDESTDLEQVTGHDVGELKYAIRQSLRRHGINLFPYIFLAKPSELEEEDDGD
ncbi:MAG: hypothetical protein KY476_21665 [Planctomycetes bacterium]|nr:hypothetical protein [Planctomycetota bacterium]